MIKVIGVTKRSLLNEMDFPCPVNTLRVLAKSVRALRALINLLFSEASSVLKGSRIALSFAPKARLSSLWLLAGCWIQLQNGCMYFPDKTGIFPDIKTSQEFTDFSFLCM